MKKEYFLIAKLLGTNIEIIIGPSTNNKKAVESLVKIQTEEDARMAARNEMQPMFEYYVGDTVNNADIKHHLKTIEKLHELVFPGDCGIQLFGITKIHIYRRPGKKGVYSGYEQILVDCFRGDQFLGTLQGVDGDQTEKINVKFDRDEPRTYKFQNPIWVQGDRLNGRTSYPESGWIELFN